MPGERGVTLTKAGRRALAFILVEGPGTIAATKAGREPVIVSQLAALARVRHA